MISTKDDVMVFSEGEFERLPDEGRWEVVDGRSILLAPNDCDHQYLSDALVGVFSEELGARGSGFVVSAVSVFIPPRLNLFGGFQCRVPDIVVFKHRPKWYFVVGKPPELVIEILSNRRGNVERTEKIDDYALAGIREYWIINPIDKKIEIYELQGAEYTLRETPSTGSVPPKDFPGVAIDLETLWAAWSGPER